MLLRKWNYKKHNYEPYEVQEDWNVKVYTNNMEEIINCAHCGKKLKVGDSYSSYEIQTEIGIGYGICEKCYNIEFSRKNQIKGE